MTNLEFNSRPKEELRIAAKESQKSAQSHFNVAESAALTGDFGIANSLLILSVEECIKSAILIAGYFGVDLKFDIEPYFKDHKTKHKQAAEIQPVVSFLWQIREAYSMVLRNRKSAFGTVFNFAIVNVFAGIGINLRNESIPDFSRWWDNANRQKNNGFYVGFFNNQWNFPSAVSSEAYSQTLLFAKPFVECLRLVQDLEEGDNILFANDKKFTKQEIDDSEIKFTSVNEDDLNSSLDRRQSL